jgi:hypothetical protein
MPCLYQACVTQRRCINRSSPCVLFMLILMHACICLCLFLSLQAEAGAKEHARSPSSPQHQFSSTPRRSESPVRGRSKTRQQARKSVSSSPRPPTKLRQLVPFPPKSTKPTNHANPATVPEGAHGRLPARPAHVNGVQSRCMGAEPADQRRLQPVLTQVRKLDPYRCV